MKFTIGQAAKATGKSKSTISRAIKKGVITATPLGDRYEIDASELFRVFPATGAQNSPSNNAQPPIATGTTPPPPATADVEIKMLREMLDREREMRDQEREQAREVLERERATVDDLRQRLTRAELLLTDQRPRRRWWHWG